MSSQKQTLKLSLNNIVLLDLLKGSLFNADVPLPDEDIDWQGVKILAQKHAVQTTLYRCMKRLPHVPDEITASLFSMTVSSVLRNERMMEVQSEIVNLLQTNLIPYAVLKGSSIAVLYSHSEMRILGDIDLLVEPERLKEACDILAKAGYCYSGGHTFHECFEGNGVHVEVHQAVSRFPDNQKGRYTAAYMKGALNHTPSEVFGYCHFNVLDAVYQLVAILSHMERHMTESGIGLRQLCDWAVTINHYREEINDETLKTFDQCGLLRFAETLTKACAMHLGLPECHWAEKVSVEMANALMEEILTSGNMQNISTDRGISSAFVSGKKTDKKSRTIMGRYIININSKARKDYPNIAKFFLVLPYFWLYYPARWWVRSLRGERERVSISDTLSIAGKRKKLYEKLKLFE